MLSTRSGAVLKGIRHIESKRVRLDSRRPAIRAAKLGKPTPGLASLKSWMEIARRWNLSEREKRGSFEVAIIILLPPKTLKEFQTHSTTPKGPRRGGRCFSMTWHSLLSALPSSVVAFDSHRPYHSSS